MIVLPRLLRNYLTTFQIWLLVTNEIRHYMSKKPYVNVYRAFVWRLQFLPKAYAYEFKTYSDWFCLLLKVKFKNLKNNSFWTIKSSLLIYYTGLNSSGTIIFKRHTQLFEYENTFQNYLFRYVNFTNSSSIEHFFCQGIEH